MMQNINFIQSNLTTRRMLWLIVLWQVISVMLMGLGVWPDWIAWLNFSLIAFFIALADPFEGLLLVIVSIPWFIVIPNPFVPDLPMWRPLFAWLFAVWLGRTLYRQRAYLTKLFLTRQFYRQSADKPASQHFDWVKGALQRVDSRFLSWDKYMALFFFIMVLSLLFAHFRIQAIKQIIFLVNIFLVYIVLINVTTTRERLISVIKYSAASTATIVLLGYVQFIATLFSSPYYFWQYWAVMISRVYYGQPLADVLIYSNSWFSYTSQGQSLRMFSIMPDSHSFAMVAVLCMGFCLSLLSHYQFTGKPFWKIVTERAYYLWYVIRFAGLGIILSGTRGMWVGMIPALFVSAFLFIRNFARTMMRKLIIAQLLIILFFALSPLINYGLQTLRVSNYEENFLERARSIYDLEENSNVGRLIIWKESVVYAALHPFGVGYGNFIVSIVRDIPAGYSFDQVSNEKNLRYNLPQKFVSAHSLYLNLLVELGLAGILSFGLLFLVILSKIWQFLKIHKDSENIFTMMAASMGVVIVWFLAYGVFDVTLFNDRVLTYFLIGLGVTGLIIRRYDSFGESSRKQVVSDMISK